MTYRSGGRQSGPWSGLLACARGGYRPVATVLVGITIRLIRISTHDVIRTGRMVIRMTSHKSSDQTDPCPKPCRVVAIPARLRARFNVASAMPSARAALMISAALPLPPCWIR